MCEQNMREPTNAFEMMFGRFEIAFFQMFMEMFPICNLERHLLGKKVIVSLFLINTRGQTQINEQVKTN